MFRAGSNLVDKHHDEILRQDFKKFTIQDISFGVGQINSIDFEEEKIISDKLKNSLKWFQERRKTWYDIFYDYKYFR